MFLRNSAVQKTSAKAEKFPTAAPTFHPLWLQHIMYRLYTFYFALVGYKSPELWIWSLAGIIRGVLWVWIDPINFFTTGVGWWCDWSSAGGMVCLSPRCEPDRDYARAWADKCDTQNKVMMFGSVLRECHLYVWGKPSAAYPLLISRLALTGALSPSFLIISARLHQRNSLISNLKHTFISQHPHPPPFSAAGRSGVYLSPLLSEHWRVGERRRWRDRAQIIMVGQLSVEKGAGELGGEEDYRGEWINTPVNF